MKNFIIKVTIVVVADTSRDSMMVDLPLVVDLEVVHVGRHQDVVKWFDQVEEQPDVDHLDIGRLWKVVADIDEHCSENQHHCDIQRYHGFKEEFLKIVG